MTSMIIASSGGFKFKEPPSDIIGVINGFRKAGDFCDIKLKVGGREFPTHKVVLAASSDYFKVLFTSQFPEAQQSEMDITTIDAYIMEIILDFVYSNVIEITSSNVLAVMHAASFLQVDSLVHACCNYLDDNLCVNVCFGVWRLKSLISDRFQNLAEKAQTFIVNNFSVACQNQDFFELETDDLIDVIKSDSLNVDTEDVVFEAVARWLCSDKERFAVFDKVLSHVRLAHVNPTVLQDWTESMDLYKSPSCLKLVEEARNYHVLHPSRRSDVLSSIRIRRFSAIEHEALVIQNRDGSEKNLMCITRNGVIAKNIMYPPEKTRLIVASSYNNVILAGCWEKVFQYHFENDEWLEITSNVKPRYLYGLCELDGSFYSVGGNIVGGRVSDVLEKYDPDSKLWKQLSFMTHAVSYPAVVSHKGRVFVLGGNLNDSRGCDHVQRYDPRRKTWTILTNIPVPLQFPAACVLDGLIYVFNFSRELNADGRRLFAYNVSTDKWHRCRDIPSAFLGGPAIMEGSIYVLANDKGNNSSIMCYTPSADSWRPFGNLEDVKSKLMCGPIIL